MPLPGGTEYGTDEKPPPVLYQTTTLSVAPDVFPYPKIGGGMSGADVKEEDNTDDNSAIAAIAHAKMDRLAFPKLCFRAFLSVADAWSFGRLVVWSFP